jgi:hypothetical protein
MKVTPCSCRFLGHGEQLGREVAVQLARGPAVVGHELVDMALVRPEACEAGKSPRCGVGHYVLVLGSLVVA